MASAPRPYILAETNWKTVRETDYRVAVLPWGATEAHNYHLPYATDNFQVDAVAAAAAKVAWDGGQPVIVLPCVPFGVNTGQADIDLCLNMNPTTQLAVLNDLCEVIVAAGIDKLVILNGHGGNQFKALIRELAGTYTELFICQVNWYLAGGPFEFFDEPGDHAGELETSMMMNLTPDWVRPLSEAGSGRAKKFRFAAFSEGWAISQRRWSQVTEDTGSGNPAAASASKGQAYLDACAAKIGQFLIELSDADVDNLYV